MADVRLIDANKLLKQCIEGDGDDEFTEGYNFAVQEISAYITLAPTIEAEPVRRGKWEWEPGYVGTTEKCSVCGLSPMGFYSLPINQIGRLPEYPFCPKCGADMRGDDVDN